MKKFASTSFLIIMGLALLVSSAALVSKTSLVHADECTEDGTGQYCLIEPIPLGDGNATFSKYDGGATSAGSYINLLIKVFISIIGALGVIMIVLGGVQYMTTDAISKKEGGREMISNSIFGLILALASWILLQTINPNLNVINLNPPEGVAVSVSSEDAPPEGVVDAAPGTPVCTQSPTINGTAITQGAAWGSAGGIGVDTTERNYLTTHSVPINVANCAAVGDTGCTSVAGYPTATMNKIISLRIALCGSASTCAFTLTGGTECWLHATHGPGLDKADFAATPAINQFVTGNSSFPTTSQTYTKTFSSITATFLAEQAGQTQNTTAQHWHVSF